MHDATIPLCSLPPAFLLELSFFLIGSLCFAGSRRVKPGCSTVAGLADNKERWTGKQVQGLVPKSCYIVRFVTGVARLQMA